MTISVTAGTYGQGFQSNAGAGRTAQGSAPVVAVVCGDVRDNIISEYATSYASGLVSFVPVCTDFTQNTPSAVFPFSLPAPIGYSNMIGYLSWSRDYPTWAILTSYLGANLDILQLAPGMPFQIVLVSGYRDPVSEEKVNPGTKDSRHTHGDAVDISTQNSSLTNWPNMHDFIRRVTNTEGLPCIETLASQNDNPNHVHVDWRSQATCPTNSNGDWTK